MPPSLTLVIGNKNGSSWSLRPWLALVEAGLAFEEELIPLDRPDTAARIGRRSPGGKVPVLLVDGEPIWESLAILELAAELAPALWPAERTARARARAVSAEMHAGFAALRSLCPMDVTGRRRWAGPLPAALAGDVARVGEIWRDARARHGAGGPFLFGPFTAADAMFAPVVTRFVTYALPRDGTADGYIDAVTGLPGMRAWAEAARAEVAAEGR